MARWSAAVMVAVVTLALVGTGSASAANDDGMASEIVARDDPPGNANAT